MDRLDVLAQADGFVRFFSLAAQVRAHGAQEADRLVAAKGQAPGRSLARFDPAHQRVLAALDTEFILDQRPRCVQGALAVLADREFDAVDRVGPDRWLGWRTPRNADTAFPIQEAGQLCNGQLVLKGSQRHNHVLRSFNGSHDALPDCSCQERIGSYLCVLHYFNDHSSPKSHDQVSFGPTDPRLRGA